MYECTNFSNFNVIFFYKNHWYIDTLSVFND